MLNRIFLILVILASRGALAAQICGDWLVPFTNPDQILQVLSKRWMEPVLPIPLMPQRKITPLEMSFWTESSWEREARTPRLFTDGFSRSRLQEILFAEDFSPLEQKLMRRMVRLSATEALRQVAYANEYDQRLADLRGLDFTEDQMQTMAKKFAEEQTAGGVESGFYLLGYKSGAPDVRFVWSADRAEQISGRANSQGLRSVWSRRWIDEEVAYCRFFHFHTRLRPLSDGDYKMWNSLREHLKVSGLNIPVDIYALAQYKDRWRIFHGL